MLNLDGFPSSVRIKLKNAYYPRNILKFNEIEDGTALKGLYFGMIY